MQTMLNSKDHKKESSDKEIKTFILKKFFNSSNQKKAVKRAVQESMKDQQALMEEYRKEVQ